MYAACAHCLTHFLSDGTPSQAVTFTFTHIHHHPSGDGSIPLPQRAHATAGHTPVPCSPSRECTHSPGHLITQFLMLSILGAHRSTPKHIPAGAPTHALGGSRELSVDSGSRAGSPITGGFLQLLRCRSSGVPCAGGFLPARATPQDPRPLRSPQVWVLL